MLDIHALMGSLAKKRPIFHSEADFQHALAWEIREATPGCEIRLEYNPDPGAEERMALDIWVQTGRVAIELKYPKREFRVTVRGERFSLKDNAAQDLVRYDYIKDIQRLENEVSEGRANDGFAVLLTNDQGYWNPSKKNEPVDAAFRLHEGQGVTGELMWSNTAGEGTKKGREKPLVLKGLYRLHWCNYQDLHQKNSRFRYLAAHVRDL